MSNNLDAVIETDEFKSLDKQDLCACIEKLNRNHATEVSIFNGLVVWSKVDDLTRKNNFPELFKYLIKLGAMPVEILDQTVLKEDLVTENKDCWKLVTKDLCQRYKSFSATNIVSFGGTKSLRKSIKLYNCSNKPSKEYPDLPSPMNAHCSLLSNNFVYCIGGSIGNDDGQSFAQSKV